MNWIKRLFARKDKACVVLRMSIEVTKDGNEFLVKTHMRKLPTDDATTSGFAIGMASEQVYDCAEKLRSVYFRDPEQSRAFNSGVVAGATGPCDPCYTVVRDEPR